MTYLKLCSEKIPVDVYPYYVVAFCSLPIKVQTCLWGSLCSKPATLRILNMLFFPLKYNRLFVEYYIGFQPPARIRWQEICTALVVAK